jgi:hypothetical protein
MAGPAFPKRPILVGAIAAALLGIGLTVVLRKTPDASPGLDGLFERLDVNRNGFIDRHEAWADPQVEDRFGLADRNHDGRLDREEFHQLGRPKD